MRRSLYVNVPAVAETVALVTVTAPGADVLPWSSETPGRVDEDAAREWNRTAQSRWSELHRQAGQTAKRRVGGQSRVVSRVWQTQARGVLHVHVLLVFDSLEDRRWVKEYVGELRRLGPDLGFGFVDFRDRAGKAGKPSVMEASRAAGYVSRYLSESSQLSEAVQLRDRPPRLVYVSPRSTLVTGCTMRRLRRVRFLWWIRQGRSSWVARFGLPAWVLDPFELSAVEALASPP